MNKRGREVIPLPNVPEKQKEQEQFQAHGEEAGLRRVEKGTELEVSQKEHETFLRTVDFIVLSNIFREFSQKSGMNPEQMNFLGPDRITHGTFGIPGEYDGYQNIIRLGHYNIEQAAEPYSLDIQLTTLKVLLHEEVHATSKVRCYEDLELKHGAREDVGYARTIRREVEPGVFKYEKLFALFNEGITEKLSLEVLQEYTDRSRVIDREEIEDFSKRSPFYRNEVQLVEKVIEVIAHKTGLPKDFVWRGFIRGLYQGDDLYEAELRSLLEEVLGEDAVDALARGESPSAFQLRPERSVGTVRGGTSLKAKLSRLFERVRTQPLRKAA